MKKSNQSTKNPVWDALARDLYDATAQGRGSLHEQLQGLPEADRFEVCLRLVARHLMEENAKDLKASAKDA